MPEPIPTPEPTSTPSGLTYVIRNSAGVAVGLSTKPVYPERPEGPEAHAIAFLNYLVNQRELAGTLALEKVLQELYEAIFCPREEISPLPWLSVLRFFNKVLKTVHGQQAAFKTYVPTYTDGRRRKARAYRIPLLDEVLVLGRQEATAVA
jgi:hypothetical protein